MGYRDEQGKRDARFPRRHLEHPPARLNVGAAAGAPRIDAGIVAAEESHDNDRVYYYRVDLVGGLSLNPTGLSLSGVASWTGKQGLGARVLVRHGVGGERALIVGGAGGAGGTIDDWQFVWHVWPEGE
jgi:hypothetical protein